jgi:hypothetical protein
MWKTILVFLAITIGAYQWWTARPESHGPGIVAPNAPLQRELSDAPSFVYKGYRVAPLARFAIEARVLSREDYRFGRQAELSPIDLALGWGRMSDEVVLKRLEVRQSDRFFYWSAAEFPIPRQEIEASATNVHVIPAESGIEQALRRLRRGNVVNLRGYLVRVEADDGWRWVSSLSREDTGNGSCELMWVEELEVR